MKLIKTIKDKEIPADQSGTEIRFASRAIAFDTNNLIPILFVSKYNYHKLPGGGIDSGEEPIESLKRECLEEIGSQIEIIKELGKVVEYRSDWDFKQTSYCYIVKILTKNNPCFTEKEINEGFQIKWMNLEEAISELKKETSDYGGKFIQERDLAFLNYFKHNFSIN